MSDHFVWSERLGIYIPYLTMGWEQYNYCDQIGIIEEWEFVRGSIPDRIMVFEHVINEKQAELNDEENFERSCLLTYEIAEYASRINELQIWYRMNQELESRQHS
ncbi:hypothetical protein [Paenibacillus sp. L3-i20]|uniref:hypothetical protein n=1 Tax=Paenibacillus sp. L3-i20 TaxID=2905833 RepID=UPI001EDD38D5|nr:hypothetical protein [Paenibacillus sp. L3-i20]GKU79794.1 hypothetical protein L3i20_v241910 [Paenibacillus sp. L3-i20]